MNTSFLRVLACGLAAFCLSLAACTETTIVEVPVPVEVPITVEAPTIDVIATGNISTVTLASATEGATIYYTTDGTAATSSGAVYSAPIAVAGYLVSITINAVAAISEAFSEVTSMVVANTTPYSLSIGGTVTALTSACDGIWDITTDGTYLYVTNYDANTILKVAISTGETSVLAGSGTAEDKDGVGTGAGFNGPSGITTDGTNLYVTDWTSCTIRKVVISTGEVTTLAGSGTADEEDGIGTAASFNKPDGITTDGTNLYVADYYGCTIRKVVIATGAVTTIAGYEEAFYTADGTGTAAEFDYPQDVVFDGTSLYVTEWNGCVIRKIVISSAVVTTPFGDGTNDDYDGTGTGAHFRYPHGIATDGTNLWVTNGYGSIRRIGLSSGIVTTVVTGTGTACFRGITVNDTCLHVVDTSSGVIDVVR